MLYTSTYFCWRVYLYELDHYIVNNLGLKYKVRYMDDYIVISNDKDKLKRGLENISFILTDKYKLDINVNKTSIYDCYGGVEYLGYIFSVKNNKTIIRVKNQNNKGRLYNMKKNYYLYRIGYISFKRFFNSLCNYKNCYKHSVRY